MAPAGWHDSAKLPTSSLNRSLCSISPRCRAGDSEKRLLLGKSRLIFSLASGVVVVSRSPSTISTGARIEPRVVLYDADRLTEEA